MTLISKKKVHILDLLNENKVPKNMGEKNIKYYLTYIKEDFS